MFHSPELTVTTADALRVLHWLCVSMCVGLQDEFLLYTCTNRVVVMWSTLINKVMIIWYMKLDLFLSLIDWGMVACYDNKWVDLLFCKVLYIANILMNLCTLSCLWLGHDVIALNVLCRTNIACFLYMYKVQYLYPFVLRSDGWNFSEISYVTHLKEIVVIRYSSLDLNTMHVWMRTTSHPPKLKWANVICLFVSKHFVYYLFSKTTNDFKLGTKYPSSLLIFQEEII